MLKRLKSKKTIIALLVVLCVAVTCIVAAVTASAGSSVSTTFSEPVNDGTARIFRAVCTTADNNLQSRYLKVVKNYNGLSIYEADTFDAALKATEVSENLTGTVSDFINETWTISIDEVNYLSIDDLESVVPSANYNFADSQNEGKTGYFTLEILHSDGQQKTNKFLKIVKNTGYNTGDLTVYEADSLAGAVDSSITSTDITGTWTCDPQSGKETWSVSALNPEYLALTVIDEVNTVLEVSNLPTDAGLPEGAASYSKVALVSNYDSTLTYKYLKVVKALDRLQVYSANTLENFEFSDISDPNFAALPLVSGEASPYTETWLLALSPESEYSRIFNVSSISTTVTASKVWEGANVADYIDVADDTAVMFDFILDGATEKTIWVKKLEGRLKVSFENQDYSDSLVYEGKTVNALLLPANNSFAAQTAEQWIITVTGYDRENADGSIIEYKFEEKDIISTQHWKPGKTEMVHTFAGERQTQAHDVVYTLVLKTAEGKDFDIIRITKTVFAEKVTRIEVEGLTGPFGSDGYNCTFATVSEARCGNVVMLASGEPLKITFDNSSDIKLNDISSSEQGVTVIFHTGENNGLASVTLKLTPSGKLSYEFKDLPADVYMVDPNTENSKINVNSYKVVTANKDQY